MFWKIEKNKLNQLISLLIISFALSTAIAIYSSGSKSVSIDPDYIVCETDSDCTIVPGGDCDMCDCGVYINKEYKDEYLAEFGEKCDYPTESKCDTDCHETLGACVSGKCATLVWNN